MLRVSSKFGIGKSSHHHIVYLNEEQGVGECSVSGITPHSHAVEWVEPVAAEVDEATGEEVFPAQPGYFRLLPDAEDGHTHEDLQEYQVTQKRKKEKESDVIAETLELYRAAKELESESKEKAEESDAFYFGEQWDESAKRELAAQKRACLTINYTAPKIDELCGHQRQTRSDIHLVPVEGGDQRTCDLYNVVIKKILENCYFPREESKVFEDGVIGGRGAFNLFLDVSKNLLGDLIVERFPPSDFGSGEHNKDDFSDSEFIYKEKMYSLARIKSAWPDKADEVQKDFDFLSEGGRLTQYSHDHYEKGSNPSDVTMRVLLGGNLMVDMLRKEYRVVEVWRKQYVDGTVAVHWGDEYVESLYGWAAKDVAQVRTIPGFNVIRKTETKIRITKIAGGVVLSDENPANLPVDDFMLVPFYAYKRGNKYQGKVEFVKDVQREINKRRSQAVDIGNRMTSYVYFYDDMTFPGEPERKAFLSNQATPGALLRVNDQNRPPTKWDGVRFPTELLQLEEISERALDRILNISPREPGANTSAAAILQSVQQKLIGNEKIFESFWFAKKVLGHRLIRAIQRYYSSARIYRMVSAQNQKSPVNIGGQPFEEFSKQEIQEILENADVSTMDAEIAESTYSPTRRLAIFMLLQEAAKAGVYVSPKVLVKYMDAPEAERAELLADLEAEAAQAGQAEQEKADSEITKTLIAQGFVPPQIREKFGVGDPSVSQQQPQANGFENTGVNSGLAQMG